MTRQDGRSAIRRLVDDFEKNERQYMSRDFQETENRDRFIDPFFTALGWDFYQTNTAKKFWDVHREFSQKINLESKKILEHFSLIKEDSVIVTLEVHIVQHTCMLDLV